MRIADNSHLDLTKNSKKRCININSVLSYYPPPIDTEPSITA